jgi:hypothetical protein
VTDWIAHTPPEVLAKNFGLPVEVFKNIPLHNPWIYQSNRSAPPSSIATSPWPSVITNDLTHGEALSGERMSESYDTLFCDLADGFIRPLSEKQHKLPETGLIEVHGG